MASAEISSMVSRMACSVFCCAGSQTRAAAVMKYLTDKGLAAARLTAVGYGDTKSLVPNDTPENMQRNRRIEFGVKETKAAGAATGNAGK